MFFLINHYPKPTPNPKPDPYFPKSFNCNTNTSKCDLFNLIRILFSLQLTFNKAINRGRVVHNKDSKAWIKEQNIESNIITQSCFPLYSFMLAMNRTLIDFLTLDVEGDELNVLKTIPFDKLTIRMITVEYMHVPGKSKIVRQFMEGKGFETLLTLQSGNGGMKDIIFKLRNK